MQPVYQAGRETDEPNTVSCLKQLHTPVVLPLGRNRPVISLQDAKEKSGSHFQNYLFGRCLSLTFTHHLSLKELLGTRNAGNSFCSKHCWIHRVFTNSFTEIWFYKKIFLSYKCIAIYDIFQLEIKEGRFELINFVENTVEYTGCSQILSRKFDFTKKYSYHINVLLFTTFSKYKLKKDGLS